MLVIRRAALGVVVVFVILFLLEFLLGGVFVELSGSVNQGFAWVTDNAKHVFQSFSLYIAERRDEVEPTPTEPPDFQQQAEELYPFAAKTIDEIEAMEEAQR